MKIIQPLSAVFVLAITASTAQAFTPPYHVDNEGEDMGGYFGSVTIRASGSCGFRTVSYRNAWFGNLFDSLDEPVGYGIITASGELLVLEEDYARMRYSENIDIGVSKETAYTSMVGPELVSLVMGYSGCSIESIVPNTNSRSTSKWDAYKGKDHLQLKANFSGFEEEVCQGADGFQQCRADKFSGSIIFKGDWSTPG